MFRLPESQPMNRTLPLVAGLLLAFAVGSCLPVGAQDTGTAATAGPIPLTGAPSLVRGADGSYSVVYVLPDGSVVRLGSVTVTAPATTPPATSGGMRMTYQGKASFWVGANVAAYNWSQDFGGGPTGGGVSNPTNRAAIEARVAPAAAAGVKVLRWWLTSGDPWQFKGPAGNPVLNTAVYTDLDAAVSLAKKYKLALHLVFFSAPSHIPAAWITNTTQRAAVAKLCAQVAARYKAEPTVAVWESFNEPENDLNATPPKADRAGTLALATAIYSAIRATGTPALVTVGGLEIADANLWSGAGDFYSPHFYASWMTPGTPWYAPGFTSPAAIRTAAGLAAGDAKPLALGECYLGGSDALSLLNTLYTNGYAGVYGWSLFWDRTGASDQQKIDLAAVKAFTAAHADTGPVMTAGGGTETGGGGTTPPPPAAPPNFTGSFIATKGAVLSWGVVAGADHYILHRTSDGGDPDAAPPVANIPAPASGGTVTYTDATALPAATQTMYRYCPAAVMPDGTVGPCSPDVMITVPAVVVVTPPPVVTPPTGNLPALTIEKIIPNDDSFVIKVTPYPGAVDYLAFDDGNPSDRKASGGNVLLEWNGPVKGRIVVQALSVLAPFSPHGQMSGMAGMGAVVTNGQGAPTNTVNAIAQSAPITPQYKPITASPGATQFSLYRTPATATLTKMSDGKTNAKWVTSDAMLTFTAQNADFLNTDSFLSHTHFMESLWDGGTPGSGLPLHVQNATLTMDYAPTFDFSGGKVFHAFVEVDAHFDSRRWCEMAIIPAGDQVLTMENVEIINNGGADWSHTPPTTSGNLLLWRWDQFHKLFLIKRENGVKVVYPVTHVDWGDPAGAGDRFGPALRGTAEGNSINDYRHDGKTTLNGPPNKQLDLRSRFDIYLSASRIVGYETDPEGVRVKVFDKPMPAAGLGFTKARIVVDHKLYHSSLEQQELITNGGAETQWISNTPFSEVRHWDGLGGEVLPDFPAI